MSKTCKQRPRNYFDIAVDVDGNAYEFDNVYLEDSDTCSLQIVEGEVIACVGEHGRNIGRWIPAEEETETNVVGIWKYDAYDIYLLLDADGFYAEVVTDDVHITEEGSYTTDGSALTLISDYDGLEQTHTIEDGVLYDVNYDSLSYAGSFDSQLYDEILGMLAAEVG